MKISHFATFLPKVSFLAISVHLMDIHYIKHLQEIGYCGSIEPLFKSIGQAVLEIWKQAILGPFWAILAIFRHFPIVDFRRLFFADSGHLWHQSGKKIRLIHLTSRLLQISGGLQTFCHQTFCPGHFVKWAFCPRRFLSQIISSITFIIWTFCKRTFQT